MSVNETTVATRDETSFLGIRSAGQRLAVALVGSLVAALLVFTVGANWSEDLAPVPAEGSLLVDRGAGTVYLYQKGAKRPIVNGTTLSCLRRPGQHFIPYRWLDRVPTGPPVANRENCPWLFPPGILIRPMGRDDVYISTGTTLRRLPNVRTLACVANLRSIEDVSPTVLDLVPIASEVPDGEGCR